MLVLYGFFDVCYCRLMYLQMIQFTNNSNYYQIWPIIENKLSVENGATTESKKHIKDLIMSKIVKEETDENDALLNIIAIDFSVINKTVNRIQTDIPQYDLVLAVT